MEGSVLYRQLDWLNMETKHRFYKVSSSMLVAYTGEDRDISIPDDMGLTMIGGGRESIFAAASRRRINGKRWNINSVKLPTGISHINTLAFHHCALKEIDIPQGVCRLCFSSLRDCSLLRKITLPASLTNIDWMVFAGCTSLKQCIVKAVNPPKYKGGMQGDDWVFLFHGANPDLRIYVPDQSLDAYKNDDGWGEYKDNIYPGSSLSSRSGFLTLYNVVEELEKYDQDLKIISFPDSAERQNGLEFVVNVINRTDDRPVHIRTRMEGHKPLTVRRLIQKLMKLDASLPLSYEIFHPQGASGGYATVNALKLVYGKAARAKFQDPQDSSPYTTWAIKLTDNQDDAPFLLLYDARQPGVENSGRTAGEQIEKFPLTF
jgi:hypothetical protein